MANIGVSELLLDPDFVDPCVVLRLIETVGQDGIARRVVQPIQILASVQSNSDNLVLSPDMARTQGAWECITTFPLNEATETTAADEVVWRGMEFTVTSVGKFGNFATGFGHYEAIMELKPVRTKAPTGATLWVDNTVPVSWVDNGQPVIWDMPGASQTTTTQWTDATTNTQWQDNTTTTVWDVNS